MRLGILTGGGDAPGLNAAVRAVVRAATVEGDTVIGIRNGWAGLMGDADLWSLGRPDVAGILQLGGTVLGTGSRVNPVEVDGGADQVLRNFEGAELDGLVSLGGDGTLSIAADLWRRGLPVVGLPKTIDNDLSGTEYCIGFDTAVSRVSEALDRLHTTAAAHHRVLVLETMGRNTGWLAVMGGLAGGADLVLIPEVPSDVDQVVAHLDARLALGSDFSLVVVAEGMRLPGLYAQGGEPQVLDEAGHPQLARRAVGEALARMIEARTGHETRATVLGHTQRGGPPTAYDRVWATHLGVAAYRLAAAGRSGRVAVVERGRVTDAPLPEVARQRPVPRELYELAGIFF